MYAPIFFVLIACVTSILGNTSQTSKCSKTICPVAEATICIKVKPKNVTQIRYVMMSKCELKQLECFNDVKTAVVPVKLCKASSLRDGASNDEDSDVSEIQAKISEIDKPIFGPVQEALDNQDDYAKGGGFMTIPYFRETSVSADGSESPIEATTDEPQSKEGSQAEEMHKEFDYSEVTATEQQANDKDSSEKQNLNNEDDADDGSECPQKCPTRDVMVCARCSHGVYRTFMSVCYMRMYQCQNPKERLELVSRHACQGSAPYLGEMSRPSNNLAEPQDNDPVLNYIFTAQDNGHPKF